MPEAQLIAYPGDSARLMPEWDLKPESVTVYTGVADQESSANGKGRIVVDPARTVTDPTRASTVSVTLHPGDTAVIDLGQNLVGVPRYTLRGPAGAQVAFKPGRCSTTTARAPTALRARCTARTCAAPRPPAATS